MKSLISAGRGCLSAAVAMFVLAGGAHASPIDIHNTGVNGSGVLQPDGSVALFYSFGLVPLGCSGCATPQVLRSSGGYPFPSWLADSAISAWIGPNATSAVGPAGNYTYQTTFDLSGFDPTTATITGKWATDNSGTVLLNSGSTGITNTTGFGAFSPTFTISSGFVAGLNTLDFVVNNVSGPTGLRVEMTGTADLQQGVPEPASLLLLGAGLVAFGMFRRRLA